MAEALENLKALILLYSYVHTKHNIDSLAVTILSMHNHDIFVATL